MRGVARIAAASCLAAGALLPVAAAAAGAASTTRVPSRPAGIPLPPTLRNIDPLSNPVLNLRKDRLRRSSVPGSVDDTEAVTVEAGPDGTPMTVTDRQQLVVHGAGSYLIYELGPARAVEGLNDLSLPTAELGQVVWQGFSPGSRSLAGLLTLDPAIEAARLPMSMTMSFRDAGGRSARLLAGGRAPSDGTVSVTLTNQTQSPRFVAVGTADAGPLARVVDTLLAAARANQPGVPPYAGGGLPVTVPGTLAGQQELPVVAPLRVHGSIDVTGATGNPVTGPGTTAHPGGATVAGTLQGAVTFAVAMRGGQRLALDLDVQPWIDARTLTPPAGATTWAAWAARGPSAQDRAQATATMLAGAAAAARAADYSPYLQTDTNGRAASSFRYTLAPAATTTRRAGEALHAHPGAVTAALVAMVAIAGNAALLRRRW